MIFQIYNERGDIIFNTTDMECLPNEKDVKSMVKAKYKFKLDGKIITKNKLFAKFNKTYKQDVEK